MATLMFCWPMPKIDASDIPAVFLFLFLFFFCFFFVLFVFCFVLFCFVCVLFCFVLFFVFCFVLFCFDFVFCFCFCLCCCCFDFLRGIFLKKDKDPFVCLSYRQTAPDLEILILDDALHDLYWSILKNLFLSLVLF